MQEQVNSAMESAREAAASVGERVTDFFQGNPFTTPCGRKIEMATDASSLATENWGLNMEICDFINNTADGGRDAIRAIRKRLHTQMSKNNAIVMYTLTVLETCVKNCDIRFHELVCQKDFINELVKLIGPKFDAPQVIQERVLSLIQSWNDAFRGDPRLQGVCQVYDELKAKGVEFPMTDFDTMAPIITPKRTVFPAATTQPRQQVSSTVGPAPAQTGMPNPGTYRFVDPSHPVQPTPEQLEKLRKELDVVNNNLKVLREMLSELAPGKENPEDMQLLTELHDTCVQMQARIRDLIRAIASDQVTYELLVLNDEFNNVFEKYDRYMANRTSEQVGAGGQSTANLIEIEDKPLSQQLSALQTHDAATSHDNKKVETTYAENSTRLDQTEAGLAKAAFNKTAPISEREAAEMAQWLEAQEAKPAAKSPDAGAADASDKGSTEPKVDQNAGL
ncbi:Target of Myb protein 1 [Toxocara canis]|uniref:Target of Myb protein 1 n=1 Tax=Toxocara canis TaxID=6265 RepID=A0A0B2UNN8_TOXCA|nr:Target of Myb protein 1 [Toxocara canis]